MSQTPQAEPRDQESPNKSPSSSKLLQQLLKELQPLIKSCEGDYLNSRIGVQNIGIYDHVPTENGVIIFDGRDADTKRVTYFDNRYPNGPITINASGASLIIHTTDGLIVGTDEQTFDPKDVPPSSLIYDDGKQESFLVEFLTTLLASVEEGMSQVKERYQIRVAEVIAGIKRARRQIMNLQEAEAAQKSGLQEVSVAGATAVERIKAEIDKGVSEARNQVLSMVSDQIQ